MGYGGLTMRKWVWIFFVIFVCQAHASQLSTEYSINIDLKPYESRQYPVRVHAKITNNSDQPVDHLVWMLYPNRFEQKLPYINDVNLHRIYPNGFSKGGIQIDSVRVNNELLDSSLIEPLSLERYGNVFIKQNLALPILPGETITVSMDTLLKVPHKFGSFGWYRKQLTMSGGWSPVLVSFEDNAFHPSYQLPLANWDVAIQVEDPYQVVLPQKNKGNDQISLQGARQVSLKVGELHAIEIDQDPYHFTIFHHEKKERKIKEPFEKLIQNFTSFVKERSLDQRKQYILAQSPLREMLVIDGTPISYFSDRAFKVIRALHHYHEIPIYKSLFMQLYEKQLSEIEHEKDLFWVQEVVAWRLTDELVQSLKIKHRDARQIGILQMTKFLPLVDRVLYTPQFAFYDVFYNLVYPKDYVRDEIRRYPNRQPFGQTILAHMEDEFGKEKAIEMIDAYIRELPKGGFRDFAAKYIDKNLDDRFAQWVKPRPRINYKLGRHHKKKIGLKYHHWITIEQETDANIVEPVALKVTYKDKTKETQKWMSTEPVHTFKFLTDKKIKAIEIDPNERLLETTKADNRRPAYWKFVVLSMFVEYDFEEKEPLVFMQGQFRKRHGGLDRFDIGGYYLFNAYGANVGYTRLFGKAIDALRMGHGFRVGLNFNRLESDTAVVQTSPSPSEIEVTEGGYATDIALSYVFGNQLSYINPLQGAYGGLTLRLSNPLMASQFTYRLLTLNTAGIIQLHPNHLWGIRFQLGTSGASEMPTQLQYRLGGITSMRGLPLTNDRFTGKHIILLSNEYRHFIAQDIDINLGLFRIRKIQGALYSNAGHATNTVQEQADVQANLATSTSGFSDLFDVSDWKVDVGYGIRLHIHYLGVSPSLISFDVARSVTEDGFGWLYYLGVNQSF